jgi:hypothetical protein
MVFTTKHRSSFILAVISCTIRELLLLIVLSALYILYYREVRYQISKKWNPYFINLDIQRRFIENILKQGVNRLSSYWRNKNKFSIWVSHYRTVIKISMLTVLLVIYCIMKRGVVVLQDNTSDLPNLPRYKVPVFPLTFLKENNR